MRPNRPLVALLGGAALAMLSAAASAQPREGWDVQFIPESGGPWVAANGTTGALICQLPCRTWIDKNAGDARVGPASALQPSDYLPVALSAYDYGALTVRVRAEAGNMTGAVITTASGAIVAAVALGVLFAQSCPQATDANGNCPVASKSSYDTYSPGLQTGLWISVGVGVVAAAIGAFWMLGSHGADATISQGGVARRPDGLRITGVGPGWLRGEF
jgi:hypothetical protein